MVPAGGDAQIDPVRQAVGKYAVRDYVEADPRWRTAQRVGLGHAVVTPYSAFPDDFAAPDCPRWSLHDRDDLATLGQRIEDNARQASQGKRAPTHDDVELISEILKGRGFTGYDRNAEAAERQCQADRLTSEQAMLLQVTRLLPRVEVRGGAGSGKTVLALAQARELTRGRADRPAQRIALLCYSIGLAEYLKRAVEQWPRNQRPAFVGTYEELGTPVGSAHRHARGQRLLGARAAVPDGRARSRAAARPPVRLLHRRRGAGLRRQLVDTAAAGDEGRGDRWPLRLLRREPAHLRQVRPDLRCRSSRWSSTTTCATHVRSTPRSVRSPRRG